MYFVVVVAIGVWAPRRIKDQKRRYTQTNIKIRDDWKLRKSGLLGPVTIQSNINLNHWDPKNKAVVLDGKNCQWSKKCIGLPSVVVKGHSLAIFYDAPGGNSTSHMKRDVGVAWLDLPLSLPSNPKPKGHQ